jgi:hypothetical protein
LQPVQSHATVSSIDERATGAVVCGACKMPFNSTLGVACQVSCLWGDISTSAVVSASMPLKLRYAASTNWLHRSKGCNVASFNRDAMPGRVVSCMVYPYGCHVVFSVRDTHKLRPLLVHAVVARCMPRCNSICHLMSRRRESTAAATRCSLTACRAAAVLQRRVLCCNVANVACCVAT